MDLGPLLGSTLLPFILTTLLTELLIRLLRSKGLVVRDYHKQGMKMVPRPGGPSIFAGSMASMAVLYYFMPSEDLLAMVLSVAIAFAVGMLDDFFTLGGIEKPLLLTLSAVPILALGAYDYHLRFPLFGAARLSIVYPILVVLSMPVVSNTVNMIDVMNGVVSSFMIIATIPLAFFFLLQGNEEMLLASLILISVCLAFYLYHRYPSKIFPGDSGALALGAMYGALAIVGRAEFVGMVALFPAIINSFSYLASVKGFIEHRKVKERPIEVEGGMLKASRSVKAPITLVRMLLLEGPLCERDVAKNIAILASFSSALAILTAVMI